MTNEELQEHIAAIKTARDAGEIEEFYGDRSRGQPRTLLLFDTDEKQNRLTYRIKPKPREVWIHKQDLIHKIDFPDNRAPAFTADPIPWTSDPTMWIKFREVLSDDPS